MKRLSLCRIAVVCLGLTCCSGAFAASPESGGLDLTFNVKIYPSDGGERDSFTSSLDISGDTIVSTSREDDTVIGGEDSGSAYVLERDPLTGEWAETARLFPFDGQEHDYFGESVAIGGDVIAVGTDRREAVYIYERDAGGVGAWGFTARLEAADGAPGVEFGWEVDLTDDGSQLAVAAVGKPNGIAGWVYIFERDELGAFQQVAKFGPSDGENGDTFGWGVGLRGSGGRVVVGAYLKDEDTGGAYVFDRDELGSWNETAILSASDGDAGDKYGIAVAIDDDTVLVGASHDADQEFRTGSVYVHELNAATGVWEETAKLVPFDPGERAFYGRCVAIFGNVIVIAAPGDDDLALVGGAAYLYRRDEGGAGNWGFAYKTDGVDSIERDRYAYSLAMDNHDLLVGSDRDNNPEIVKTGSLYAYTVIEEPTLSVSGSCPGSVTMDVEHAAPGGRVRLALGQVEGAFEIQNGICSGTVLGLQTPQLFAPVAVDADGKATFVRNLPASACGGLLQALDMGNCLVSGIVTLP